MSDGDVSPQEFQRRQRRNKSSVRSARRRGEISDDSSADDSDPAPTGRASRRRRNPSSDESAHSDDSSGKSDESGDDSSVDKPAPRRGQRRKQADANAKGKRASAKGKGKGKGRRKAESGVDGQDAQHDDSAAPGGSSRGRGKRGRGSRRDQASDDDDSRSHESHGDDGDDEEKDDDRSHEQGSLRVAPPKAMMRMTTLVEHAKRRNRVHADSPNELHIIGQVVGGSDFASGVSVKWFIDHGKDWTPIGGSVLGGQSQVDYPQEGDMAIWCHPIDVHFCQGAVQGWPRLLFQVLQLNDVGRNEAVGYGFVHIPSAPGCFELECPTWRPIGSLQEEISAFFIGGQPQLATDNVIFNTAWDDRSRIKSQSSGTVHVQVDVVLRHAKQQQLDVAPLVPGGGAQVEI